MDEFNPYSAPEAGISPGTLASEAEEGRGVWRDGKTLVMSKYARLPSRCVKCDEPVTNRLNMTLSWHHPAIYLVLLFAPIGLIGLMIYVVLMFIERRSMTIEVPLCQRHRDRRSMGTLIAWGVAPIGMIMLILGFASMNPSFPDLIQDRDLATLLLVVCGLTLMMFGLIYGLTSAQIVTARRIDKTHAWLNKISPSYLAALPALPNSEKAEQKKARKPATHEF